jgi:hypothetical protein
LLAFTFLGTASSISSSIYVSLSSSLLGVSDMIAIGVCLSYSSTAVVDFFV